MRGLLFIGVVLVTVSLAFWAHRESYLTQVALDEVESLQREIGRAHEEYNMLKVEWAYLNRPERLSLLAESNFERLKLLPLSHERIASIQDIALRESTPPGDGDGAPETNDE